MKTSAVYKITNKINNKKYVGSSQHVEGRWADHIKMLLNNRHHNKHLQAAFNKYGSDNFTFEILENVDVNKLIVTEQFYIDNLKPEYNFLKIAGSRLGQKHSEETKKKISLKSKGRKHTDEAKKKISKANIGQQRFLGHTHTDEAKNKQSEASKGNTYSLGYKHSEETCKKRSKASMGNKGNSGGTISEEHKQAIIKANTGRKHSAETKAKIAEKARLQHIRQNEAKKP